MACRPLALARPRGAERDVDRHRDREPARRSPRLSAGRRSRVDRALPRPSSRATRRSSRATSSATPTLRPSGRSIPVFASRGSDARAKRSAAVRPRGAMSPARRHARAFESRRAEAVPSQGPGHDPQARARLPHGGPRFAKLQRFRTKSWLRAADRRAEEAFDGASSRRRRSVSSDRRLSKLCQALFRAARHFNDTALLRLFYRRTPGRGLATIADHPTLSRLFSDVSPDRFGDLTRSGEPPS